MKRLQYLIGGKCVKILAPLVFSGDHVSYFWNDVSTVGL